MPGRQGLPGPKGAPGDYGDNGQPGNIYSNFERFTSLNVGAYVLS